MRNAADLALLTREQELAALSARKTLADAATSSNIREKSPEMEILSRAEDVLQKRIMEDASRIQGGINNNVADSTLRAADALAAEEDNSVKEVAEKVRYYYYKIFLKTCNLETNTRKVHNKNFMED